MEPITFSKSNNGSSGSGVDSRVPDNPKRRSDKYLKDHRIDPHEFKYDALGDRAKISHYDIYEDKNGSLWLLEKATGKYIGPYGHINMYKCP